MKRIQAACICQTLKFLLKEDIDHETAVKMVQDEVEHYKQSLNRNGTKYKIVDESTLDDGTILIKIIKQYNNSPVGDYLD